MGEHLAARIWHRYGELVKTKERLMKKAVKPIPAGYHTVTPYLASGDAAGAIEFYKKAAVRRSTSTCT
jgi:hypothetical protein